MKTTKYIGNVIIVRDRSNNHTDPLILLGHKIFKQGSNKRKHRKIGGGCWVPPGGATEKNDKSQKHGAQREVFEETWLHFPLRSFRKVGILKGYFDFPNVPTWRVHIYLVDVSSGDWMAKPRPNKEYDEMRWFPVSELPFREMVEGDEAWIPRIVRGEKLLIKRYSPEIAGDNPPIIIVPSKSFN